MRTLTYGAPSSEPGAIKRHATALTFHIFRVREVVVAVVFMLLATLGVGYFGRAAIEQAFVTEIGAAMEATLDAAVSSAKLWLETCQRVHQGILSSAQLPAAKRCLQERDRAPCRAEIERHFTSYLSATAGCAHLVSGAEKPMIWTMGCAPLTIAEQEALHKALRAISPQAALSSAPSASLQTSASLRSRVSAGHARYVLPFLLSEDRAVSGFVSDLGPKQLLFTEVPEQELARSLFAARAGGSGETYAVDRRGRMLTESRFAHQLRAVGLLRPTQARSSLHVDSRNPGVDLTAGERTGTWRSDQPLTQMVQSLRTGHSGRNIEGYRDYRGVLVVGAWRWLDEYGFGIATEVDRKQAFSSIALLHSRFFLLLGLLGVVAVALALSSFAGLRLRQRAQLAMRRVEDLGQYQIERKLGEGGMGSVYLAHHTLLRRPTAIKVLRADRADEHALVRFEREVRTTSELSHPNTVAIYDFGRADDGRFFYAMEYLDGLDVERLVRKYGPLPDARVVHLLAQACASLDEAHQRGLVHRDIKPSNLFVLRRRGAEDVVKVLDFGIVKAEWDDARHLTFAHGVIGTPEFMSPEMFDRASAVGPQSDIYSLGATAYYMLTARPVFSTATLAEACTAHLMHDPTPPSQRVDRTIDPKLEEIILACLAKMPSSRPEGVRRLRALLLNLPCAREWSEEKARMFWTGRREDGVEEVPPVERTQVSS